MDRRERRKQKKNKERQEHLRQEKLQRQAKQSQGNKRKVDKVDPASAKSHANRPSTDVTPPDVPLDNFFLGEPARDWLEKLLTGSSSDPILRALEPAEFLPGELMLKASVSCEILVAAEVVAASRGRPSRHLPPSVAAWLLEQDLLFSPGVVRMAATAVRRVADFSELRHLLNVVRHAEKWLPGAEALIERLTR
jgi:Domain of unknown function (DUF4259)